MTARQSSFLLFPPGIVATIFEYCLPSHRSNKRSLSGHACPLGHLQPSPNEAPLLLAQICRRWRAICLDTPSLWASVSFGETRSPDLLKMWLSRARTQPLRIILQTQDDTRADNLMRIVGTHSSMWQEVDFALPRSALLRCFECLFDPDGPKSDVNGTAIVQSPLRLPLLRFLKIPEATLLRCLTAPRLERLQIPDIWGADCDTLRSFVERSCCALQSLSVKLSLSDVYQSQRIFHAVNYITHLYLRFDSDLDFAIQVQLLQDVDVFPRLARLEIRTSKYVTSVVVGDCAQLLDMLRRRRTDPSSNFESFKLHMNTPSWLSASAMDVLRALAGEGLQLGVTTLHRDTVSILLDTCAEPDVSSLSLEYTACS
ncbi:hypothetical protein C8R47DRAFT_1216026 [Mycena vitilis]|nr:hypothetical protein C8R47DRAFT_1216026 [Mycena vitilis]